MIDPNRPLELDDGTPCSVVEVAHDSILVQFNGWYDRSQEDEGIPRQPQWIWYNLSDGIFDGGDAEEMFVLRNRYDDIPDVFEDYFV